jgi:pyruvyltransferase
MNDTHKRAGRIPRRVHRAVSELCGVMLGNRIHAYWWDGVRNFGDLLTPFLLRHYGFTPIWSSARLAEAVLVGSILSTLPEDYSGYIIGCGLVQDQTRSFKKAKILALRGELTRQRIGAPAGTALGDPGLLISRFIGKRRPKRYVLGIIPHYADRGDPRIHKIVLRDPDNIAVIDVQRRPIDVIHEIDECEFILSSSLHGIVAADSLGIPNGWMLLSENVIGGGFKFSDYASASGSKMEPIYLSGNERLSFLTAMTHAVAVGVQENTEKLDCVVRGWRGEILGGR